MEQTELSFNDYVRLTLEAKIEPLELKFVPICDLDEKSPMAFRTYTTINSIILGKLKESDYINVSDRREVGIELFKHNVRHLVSSFKKIKKVNEDIKFLTVRCPSEFIERVDMYNLVKEVLTANKNFSPSNLCLEFPVDAIEKNKEKAVLCFKDLKLLKVKTAIVGCGDEEFPISKLTSINPNLVFLSPKATSYAGDRNKPQLLTSMISYINSMGVDVIAEGEEKYYNSVKRTDCIGYVFENSTALTIKEVLNLKKEDNE